ncbi:hypothetical protein [Labilithrix luteola]|uniref:hypothetical protein n=1 Tax=Labilithrix luteola TaxID=1391654 RepID=UPI0011BA5E57|nr:hypothetical protein [Labilithrix luteola]
MTGDNSARDVNDDPDERETLPPPPGSNDAYSAPTRLATMPEAVLASIRSEGPESTSPRRTQSGTRPSVPRVAGPEAPESQPSSGAMPARPRYEPMAQTPHETWLATPPKTFVPVPLPPSGTVMPQTRWESSPPSAPSSFPPPAVSAPPLPTADTSITAYRAPRSSGLLRSILVVLVFALLGALFAAATTLLGRHH